MKLLRLLLEVVKLIFPDSIDFSSISENTHTYSQRFKPGESEP